MEAEPSDNLHHDKVRHEDDCLTAAEIIRRKQKKKATPKLSTDSSTYKATTASSETIETTENIDEAIKRLEAELEDFDEDDSDSSVDDEETMVNNNGILSFSESKMDSIDHLPDSCLPAVPRRSKHTNPTNENVSSKRLRASEKIVVSNGLKSAVQEIIRNYRPRSAEKLPFYCRYCSLQMTDDLEFSRHQSLPEHKQAVVLDQKASYCKLCRKQLTSPAQLRDHVQSRPHKERLNVLKSKSSKRPFPNQRK